MWMWWVMGCTSASPEQHRVPPEVVVPTDDLAVELHDTARVDDTPDPVVAPLTCVWIGDPSRFEAKDGPRGGYQVQHDLRCDGVTHAIVEGHWTNLDAPPVTFARIVPPDGSLVLWSITSELVRGDVTLDLTVTAYDSDDPSAEPPSVALSRTGPLWIVETEHEDGDGVPGAFDNCAFVVNPDQLDGDADGLGDACDACPTVASTYNGDDDHDGIGNICDSCPMAADPSDSDGDGDGTGDVCDRGPTVADNQGDRDADGVGNACDNCPSDRNPSQRDTDGDGRGDPCDRP